MAQANVVDLAFRIVEAIRRGDRLLGRGLNRPVTPLSQAVAPAIMGVIAGDRRSTTAPH
jgi:hypothetical protein